MRCNVVKKLLLMVVLVFPFVATAASKFHDKIDDESMGLKSVLVHNSSVPGESSQASKELGPTDNAIESLRNAQALTADEDGSADNAPMDNGPVVEQV